MREEIAQLDHHVERTAKMFREAGYTLNAIRYPMSDAALAWLCQFNGAPKGWKPPVAWRYAPNAACRNNCEQKAAATGAKPVEGPLAHDGLTVSKSCDPFEDKREPRNSPAAPVHPETP